MILDKDPSTWTATEVETSPSASGPAPHEAAQPVVPVEPGIPTGNFVVQKTPTSSPRRLAVQAVIVIGVALLVGLLVFTIIRAAVGAGSDEDAENDVIDDIEIVDPGPGPEPLDSDSVSRSGTRRSSSGDEGDPSAAFRSDTVEVDPDAPAAPSQASTTPAAQDSTVETTVAATVPPTKPTTVGSSTNTTADPNPTSVTSAPTPTSATTTATTAASSTAPPTSPPTSLDPPPTTTPPPTRPPLPLIAAPGNGSQHGWETVTRFRVNAITGAAKYCWTFSTGSGQREECTKAAIYDLPTTPDGVQPGPVTVDAVAYSAAGAVVAQQRISVQILVGNLLREPDNGDEYDGNDRIRFVSQRVASADRYCWNLIQGSASTGEFCGRSGRGSLRSIDIRSLGFVEGEAKVRATAYRGSQLVADQSIAIVFE